LAERDLLRFATFPSNSELSRAKRLRKVANELYLEVLELLGG
jgi:hypothetical protein